MNSRSYFGKMNSILGSVVPLAMFPLALACFLPFEKATLSEMSSAAQVAAAREETRKKLHEKIESYEKGELGQEYHRTYPFKIPTAIRGER